MLPCPVDFNAVGGTPPTLWNRWGSDPLRRRMAAAIDAFASASRCYHAHVRTTLRIDEDLFRELKKRASREGLSLSELVNLALRQRFATEKRPRRPFRQKTRDLGRPTFDVTKANARAAELEDEEILRKVAGSS